MTRLRFPVFVLSLIASSAWAANPYWLEGKTDDRYDITVYRSATCGCCKGWVKHLEEHDFNVTDVIVDDVDKFKQQFGVPARAASCHTAVIDGISIEGHVPAQDIQRVVGGKTDIRLLTVPGMPSGTPGMDMPGAPRQDFNVYSIDKEGGAAIYRSYRDY